MARNKIGSVSRLVFLRLFTIWATAGPAADRALAESAQSSAVARSEEADDLSKLAFPRERVIAGGAVHRYRVALASGEYVQVFFHQRGIDLIASVQAPNGKTLIEMNTPTGDWGVERVSLLSEAAATYQLEVRALRKDAPEGCYIVGVQERRPATPEDRKRVAAEAAFVEGSQLRQQAGLEHQRKALEKLNDALAVWRAVGDFSREAITLEMIGDVLSVSGEYLDAMDRYKEAILATRAAMDRPGEADLLHILGASEAIVGRTVEAFAHYHQALVIAEEQGQRRLEAAIRTHLGRLYDNTGEKERAFEEYARALALHRVTRDRGAEFQTLNGLGMLHQSQGETQKALDLYQQSLTLMRALGDEQMEAWTGASVGRAYAKLAEPEKALRYLGRALAIMQATGNRHSEALMLLDIGRVYADLGDVAKALEHYSAALPIFRTVRDPRLEGTALICAGQAYARLGQRDKALAHFDQALALARSANYPYREAEALTQRGTVYSLQGEKEKALEELRQALTLRRKLGDRLGEAMTSYQMARVERDRGHLAESRTLLEAALKTVESLRGQVVSPDVRASFFGSTREYYEFYIDLLMRLHQKDKVAGFATLALEASESARARSLLDLLTDAHAEIRQSLDPELLERERSLRQRLNFKMERQIRLLGGRYTDLQARALAEEIESLMTELEELKTDVRSRSPRYAALTQPEPLTLSAIQREVLDSETLLLEYGLGEERSFLWVVTRSSLSSYELPKRSEVEAAARRVYELLTARNRLVKFETREQRRARVALADAEYGKAALALSRMVLGPVGGELGKKRLLIVSDGAERDHGN